MKSRILLADDDPSVLKMTKRRLELAGYEVIIAIDGEDVLRQVAQQPVDLILLDLRMPKLDGMEVCKRLKSQPATATIPVIILTAVSNYLEQLADRCIELGANGYLEKPFRSEQLLEIICRTLPATAQTAIARSSSTASPVRVLVVDDDPAVHASLVQLLTAPQFDVLGAANGQEAVAVLSSTRCHLALVDVIMPGMDGLATLKALRATQPGLPVIMMTGYKVEDIVMLAIHSGAVDSLSKPFQNGQQVIDTIRRHTPDVMGLA